MARSLGLQNGGVYRYVCNVLHELDQKVETGNVDIYILHNEKALQGKFPHCHEVYLSGNHSYFNRLVFDYIYSFYYVQHLGLDVVIYPKNIIPFTHYFLHVHKINTVLDLGHFEKKLHAYRFWDTLYAKVFMKFSCMISYKTVAISHSTKLDLIQKLHIHHDNIKVVHLGIESRFRKTENDESVIRKFHLQRPFLFYNGSITPRKNLLRVLEAFDSIKHLIPHKLYLTGSLKWGSAHLQRSIKEKLKERVGVLGYLEEDELIAIYSLTDLFLYPSLFEGFGLPILEAQACGCPVLTSNVTSCPEVAGKGAHFVNPYSVEEIKAGILKIVCNEKYKQTLIQRGFENIQLFSWKKTAEDILRIADGIHSST